MDPSAVLDSLQEQASLLRRLGAGRQPSFRGKRGPCPAGARARGRRASLCLWRGGLFYSPGPEGRTVRAVANPYSGISSFRISLPCLLSSSVVPGHTRSSHQANSHSAGKKVRPNVSQIQVSRVMRREAMLTKNQFNPTLPIGVGFRRALLLTKPVTQLAALDARMAYQATLRMASRDQLSPRAGRFASCLLLSRLRS